jgi:hypothetical protein
MTMDNLWQPVACTMLTRYPSCYALRAHREEVPQTGAVGTAQIGCQALWQTAFTGWQTDCME